MGHDNDLLSGVGQVLYQLLGAGAPEAVKAREGIIKNDNLVSDIRVLPKRGKKECQSKCAAVTRTQCCFETRRP